MYNQTLLPAQRQPDKKKKVKGHLNLDVVCNTEGKLEEVVQAQLRIQDQSVIKPQQEWQFRTTQGWISISVQCPHVNWF